MEASPAEGVSSRTPRGSIAVHQQRRPAWSRWFSAVLALPQKSCRICPKSGATLYCNMLWREITGDQVAERDGSGRWQKGCKSPNAGGRPARIAGVREAAQQYTEEAVETLAAIMRDVGAPPAARTAAAVALLDRGYGRPAQAVDAMLTVQHSVSDQAALVLMELAQRAKARKAEEARLIDVTPRAMA